jgi:hypothetical protein
MRKVLLLIAALSLPAVTQAQFNWEFGGSMGAANYLGDIGGNEETRRDFVYDMKIQKTRWSFGGFARYRLFPGLHLKGSMGVHRIEGDDALSTNRARNFRNLSFRNNLFEVATTAEWSFWRTANSMGRPGLRGSRKKIDMRAFVFGGIGFVLSNPKTEYNGTVYKLRPLQTEGVAYSPFAFSVPLGLGFNYTMNRHHRIGVELTWRWVNTDYLDDISTNYVDPANLPNETSRQLSNRTDDLLAQMAAEGKTPTKEDISYAASYGYNLYNEQSQKLNKRGDSNNRDNFLSLSVTYGYVIKGKNKFYKSRYKSLSQRRKVIKRKTKAKF